MKSTKLVITIVMLFLLALPWGFLEGSNQKETLRKDIKEAEIMEELGEPDGVSLNFLPNGEWRIFARGTGVYDFDDEDDRQDAYQEATLKAKGNMSKFLEEKITSAETLADISNKVKKHEKKNGGDASKSVSKIKIKNMTNDIRVNSEAIVRGVLVLESLKIPDGNGGGKIQITLGVSSKSTQLAHKVGEQMKNSQAHSDQARRAAAKKRDKRERKKSKTEW